MINKKRWTKKEDKLILDNFNSLGPKWSEISQLLEGRPENMVKNRFYSYLKKKYPDLKYPCKRPQIN